VLGDSETGTVHCEGMYSIGRSVATQHKLLEECNTDISYPVLAGLREFPEAATV